MFGIEGIQIYFPKTYVDQTDLQKFNKVPPGKYTKGLGQTQLSFAYPFEDANSMSLTVVNNLMKNYSIHPSQVGRLQVGTQTLVDKSKSTKTILMQLFKGYHDIQGATSINACYGGTNALINTLNWISSPFWDGRYGIVVAVDLAVYQDGPARPTGGAGAIALLIGPKAKITFQKQRGSFMDHQWDFYKPVPQSQYPCVDGKLSIECYLNALTQCYKTLKQKYNNKDFLQFIDYYCFHSPFYKMVQKAFNRLMKVRNPNANEEQIEKQFKVKVDPTMKISKRIGNIYTGSVFSSLISLLVDQPQINNKSVMIFSYGSGLCSTMLIAKVHSNPLTNFQVKEISHRLSNRVRISPQIFSKVMQQRQNNYGKFKGITQLNKQFIEDNVFYLSEIDQKWRRSYEINNPTEIQINKNSISSLQRLNNLNLKLGLNEQDISKFYKLSIPERIQIVNRKLTKNIDHGLLQSGGLSLQLADSMIQNVIGTLSLPLSVAPIFVINNKKYMIPFCIEEPSVVAAISSVGKFLQNYSFHTSSTPNLMIGQVHLPQSQVHQIHKILLNKNQIIKTLNESCMSMVQRGGGVQQLRIRSLKSVLSKQYVLDIIVNVCQAMGANITNMLSEKAKQIISKMGIKTGIAILSNYCIQRKALSWFQVPIQKFGWKGVRGNQLAQKIIEAYQFAKLDKYRATTHNKGIMNGIDAVCIATGQDWRAVQSSAHSYASRNGQYMPLTHYQTFQRNNKKYFKASLQIPIAVGTKGGVIQKNPLYRTSMEILGSPNAKQLSEILASVGLGQNFGALRALAVEGIQKGHMVLHARTVAQKAGIPKHLIEDACKFMAYKKKYDIQTANKFMKVQNISKL